MTVVRKKPAMPAGSVTLAVILSLVSLVFFDLMGLVIKRLSADYDAAELSAYRNIFGLIPSFIALWSSPTWHRSGRRLRVRQWGLICARGLIVTFAQLMFYLSLGLIALRHMIFQRELIEQRGLRFLLWSHHQQIPQSIWELNQ